MSATNSTSTLHLPLFIGTDKPAWLVDWNGAMNDIDSAIASLQTAESGSAASLAALSTAVNALSETVTQQTTAIETVTQSVTQLAGNVTTINGNINTINSLIGNGEPTTTDKTIIGAINELHEEIGGGSSVTASAVTYDNQTSGLTADDVQEAIDELVTMIPVTPAATSEVQSATIAAGSTQAVLTFANQAIGADTLIDVYTDNFAVVPSAVTYTTTTVTITIPAQAAAVKVAAKVQN
jgi:hypothetical protein